jgi:hypothetical protein
LYFYSEWRAIDLQDHERFRSRSFAGNRGVQHIFAAHHPDDLVIDFDRIDDRADGCRRLGIS